MVIGPKKTIYATTGAPSIVSVDLATGSTNWTVSNLPETPHDLIVGDRGYLYASHPTTGEVRVYERSSGTLKLTYHGLPTTQTGKPTDLLLRDALLFYNANGEIAGFPGPSVNYPTAAPWPAVHHDNQHTSDLNGPTHY